MNKTALLVIAVVAVGVIATVLLWPSHRLPRQHLWILTATSAQLFEMDTTGSSGPIAKHPRGIYSQKPFLATRGYPQHSSRGIASWRPVAGPTDLSTSDLDSIQDALTLYDAESDDLPVPACEFEPRNCVRFKNGIETVDVFVCLYCSLVAVQDGTGKVVSTGLMGRSSKMFFHALAKHLPDDERLQEILEARNNASKP